jgi:7-carboxy-7-deazaguanine synthase
LKINEIFFSLQGEGVYIGEPMIFIRSSGCNMHCTWCDTKYAQDKGKEMSLEEIVKEISKYPCMKVCITGGEPMIQEEGLKELVLELDSLGYWTMLETNASRYNKEIFDTFDFISVSPKPPSSREKSESGVLKEAAKRESQIKIVIANEADYEFAKKVYEEFADSHIILQPEGGKNLKNLSEWVLRDGLNVRVLPQLHKIVGLK